MAKVEYRICDRCGKKLGPVAFRVLRRKTFAMFCSTPDPYDYGDYRYELCKECGSAVNEFLRRKPEEGDK